MGSERLGALDDLARLPGQLQDHVLGSAPKLILYEEFTRLARD